MAEECGGVMKNKKLQLTKKWWREAEPRYRRFGDSGRDAKEAEEFYRAETFGEKVDLSNNRYAHAKRNMDVTVSMWKDSICDLDGALLTKAELMEDKTFWGIGGWLCVILKKIKNVGSVGWAFKDASGNWDMDRLRSCTTCRTDINTSSACPQPANAFPPASD